MEIIKKYCPLETAKNRFVFSELSYLEDTKYALDEHYMTSVRKLNNAIAKYMPLNEEEIKVLDDENVITKYKYTLRYKNLMRRYYWFINEFIPSCNYQKCCIRNGEKKWIDITDHAQNPFISDDIDDANIGAYFQISSAETGDIVCVTQLYSDLIDNFETFSNAKEVYTFVNRQIEDKEYNGTLTPYLNFTIYLEQDAIDEGEMSPYIENWIPGKIYRLNDIVYYSIDGTAENTKTYKLVSTGNSFNGYYYSTDTRLMYFDTLDSEGNITFAHWHEHVTYFEPNTAYTSNIIGKTESLLKDMARKRNDMDVSGNVLPFILHYNITESEKTVSVGSTELPYMCGFVNIKQGSQSSGITCDYLESVTFYHGSGNTEVEDAEIAIENEPIVITHNNENIFANDSDISASDHVKFVYYTDASLVINGVTWSRKTETGVRYEERRKITKIIGEYDIEDVGVADFPWVKIESNSLDETDYSNLDMLNSMRTVDYSDISVLNGQLGGNYFMDSQVFKDDCMIGLHDSRDYIDVKIERGVAESFQKHNMLGEINTLQDLENYKNGKYFK